MEGKNKRTGARVVENAKLQQPGPPRAGPRPGREIMVDKNTVCVIYQKYPESTRNVYVLFAITNLLPQEMLTLLGIIFRR